MAHIREEAADYGLAVTVPDDGEAGAATAFFKNHSNPMDLKADGDRIRFANRQLGLAFRQSPAGFGVSRLYGIEDEEEFLGEDPLGGVHNLLEIMMTLDPKHIRRDDRAKTKGSLFGLVDEMAADAFPIGPTQPRRFPGTGRTRNRV